MPMYVYEDKNDESIQVEVFRDFKKIVDGVEVDKTCKEIDQEVPTEDDCKKAGVEYDPNREWIRLIFSQVGRYYFCDKPKSYAYDK